MTFCRAPFCHQHQTPSDECYLSHPPFSRIFFGIELPHRPLPSNSPAHSAHPAAEFDSQATRKIHTTRQLLHSIAAMSFSSLVQDLSLRESNGVRPSRGATSTVSTMDDHTSRASHISRAMSYASTAATSVSISGDISSQLHGGYCHPLARSWQAERQLTKVSTIPPFAA